jgi:hypothetical protein
MSLRQRCLQFGPRRRGADRRAGRGAAELVDGLLEFATPHEQAREHRRDFFGRIPELGGLAQLLSLRPQVARLEQRRAQKEPCLGQIGVLLQRVS